MPSNSEKLFRRISLVSAIFLIACVSFVYGVQVFRAHYWPYKALSVFVEHGKNYLKYGVWAPKNLIVNAPENAAREVILFTDKNAAMDGYRAILIWDFQRSQHAVPLLNSEGEEVHRWWFRFDTLAPTNFGAGKSHPLIILNDGSIVIGLESILLARIDACSQAVWVKRGGYHHSLAWDDDGSLWIWRGEVSHANLYQFMQKFDPLTGDTLQELSLVDDFIKTSPELERIFRLPPNFDFWHHGEGPEFDAFHANDVEPLPSALLDQYPGFAAGDLLVSLRNINLVAIFDPLGKKIRWWMHGPWIRQHDPDFGVNGRITIFNNNPGRFSSNIVSVNPQDNTVDFFAVDEASLFYAEEMGKHQVLPNGNLFITVPGEGRVLEVSPQGKTVFEYNNVFSATANGRVSNARWLPTDYFKTMPHCSQQ